MRGEPFWLEGRPLTINLPTVWPIGSEDTPKAGRLDDTINPKDLAFQETKVRYSGCF